MPDIQTVGKGLNGGYQALSAVLMQQRIVDGLKSGSGAFANGQTFQCHPAAAAAGIAVLSVFDSDNIVGVCAKRGAEVRQPTRFFYLSLSSTQLRRSLLESVGEHPNVGEIRCVDQRLDILADLDLVVVEGSSFPSSLLQTKRPKARSPNHCL